MITAEKVSFSYEKGKTIIHQFTYHFEKEKSYVITGDNGVGKTTLLRLLLGLLKPDSGSVEMPENITIGYVPDYNGLYENMSLMDNIRFRLGICNKSLKAVEETCDEWMERYGLELYKDVYVRNLSLGTKKKAGLLCALLTMPEILILDEPTGGLDHSAKEELFNMLKEFKSKMMIIAVTHDTEYIEVTESIQIQL